MNDRLAQIEARIAQIEATAARMKWQPIETAPMHQQVLVARYFPEYKRWFYSGARHTVLLGKGEKWPDGTTNANDVTFWDDIGWYATDLGTVRDADEYKPTHWMPLPEPPTR